MRTADYEFRWDGNGAPDGRAAPFPTVDGRRLVLRPLTHNDYPMLQMLETSGELGVRWRYRGQTPSPEQWLATLWGGVIAQFLVVERRTETPIGLVYAYRTSFQDRHAYLGALKFDLSSRSPLMLLGFALFLDYVFRCWDFRALYMEVPAFSMPQFASGTGRYFEVEGCLREHYACGGRWWDLYILAIHRAAWEREGGRVLAVERGAPRQRVTLRVPDQYAAVRP